jgi:hypothetical protein
MNQSANIHKPDDFEKRFNAAEQEAIKRLGNELYQADILEKRQ